MERLSASELLDRNDRQSGNINPDSTGLFSTWPDSKKRCCMDRLSNWTALQKSAFFLFCFFKGLPVSIRCNCKDVSGNDGYDLTKKRSNSR